MKAKIEIHMNPFDDEVIETFESTEELDEYCKEFPRLMADQVVVNGMTLLGWDELYDFV